MSRFITFAFILFTLFSFSQPNTDIFLFDLNLENGKFQLSNFKNVSNNDGYDNQPSFLDNNTLLYAGTRNGQTDIVKYNINYDTKIFINHTDGSEYSPLKIPNQKATSAIRLEKNGDQKLYKYSLKNGESEVLIEDIVIGYHVWFTDEVLVSSVLEDNKLALYTSHIDKNKNVKHHSNIGRSLHKIPNSKLVSFIDKSDGEFWEVHSVDPFTGKTNAITATLPESEDMCWLPNGTILMGHESELYTYTPNKSVDWSESISLVEFNIKNITRLTVSSDGTKLAVVGELIDPNKKLAPKLENISWIAGNWKGNALGGRVEENWSKPSAGSMMAAFKLYKDGKVVFYEIEIIREVDNNLVLQLKHFNNDLKGWETKDETVDFPLKELTSTKAIFEGMTFEKVSDNEMNVYVDIHQKDGSIEVLKFNYKKSIN
ncbi:DUF6265 family protein [Flavobacteriaceae sp. LMIT009]